MGSEMCIRDSYRDHWGVPHIYGIKDSDTAFGLAYAHAEDDFETIQDVLLALRGNLASVKGKDSAPVEPKSCQKLDSCLAEAGAEKEDQASAKFKACFASFCKELYGETKFNKSDDTRTAMCDDKGKEAWDILAKANLKAQAALRANQKPHSLLATLSSDRPDTYTALMHLLFAQRSTVIRMGSVCSMP